MKSWYMKNFLLLFTLSIFVIYLFCGNLYSDEVTGNNGDTLTLTKDIKLSITASYKMSIVSLQVQGDGNIYGNEDLGGAWDFGVLDPSLILADNPYGEYPRTGASHYMDIRIYISNNYAPYTVHVSYTGSISNLPVSDERLFYEAPLHFATRDINRVVPDQHTQHLENLRFELFSNGSNRETGLFPFKPDINYVLYECNEITSDAFMMLVFIDNVNPNFNASLIDPDEDGIVGNVTYSMIPKIWLKELNHF